MFDLLIFSLGSLYMSFGLLTIDYESFRMNKNLIKNDWYRLIYEY